MIGDTNDEIFYRLTNRQVLILVTAFANNS